MNIHVDPLPLCFMQLNAFWDYWWALSFVAFPFLGRIWCSVCPFMIYGEAWHGSTVLAQQMTCGHST